MIKTNTNPVPNTVNPSPDYDGSLQPDAEKSPDAAAQPKEDTSEPGVIIRIESNETKNVPPNDGGAFHKETL
jgi:hypothetical protein